MYRPKFCAECGEKIIRLRWRPWHSRRFCAGCSPRFFREQSLRFSGLLLGMLIVGMAIGRAMRPPAPPLIIHRISDARDPNATGSATGSAFGTTGASGQPLLAEDVYTCGARTKKGTPCSRRVHGAVRCWQHKGSSAMLPQEKLLVKD